MKVVAIVPARSGSKSVPHKNMRRIEGQSLLERAVRIGLACESIDDVYITTDSPEYEVEALNAGAKSLGLRPTHLASDGATTVDVILDLLPRLPHTYDALVLLQPTGPVRTVSQIETTIQMLKEDRLLEGVISVLRITEPHPYKLQSIREDGYLTPFLPVYKGDFPRQSLPAVYQLTGAIYTIRTAIFIEQQTFAPQRTRPLIQDIAVNIDSEEDFLLLETLVQAGKLSLETH